MKIFGVYRDKYSEDEIIAGLINQENAICTYFYNAVLPGVIKHIKRNNGTKEDAKDIFHDAFLITIDRLQSGKLVLTSTLSAFIFAICSHLWLKRLNKNKLICKNVCIYDVSLTKNEIDEFDKEIALLSQEKLFWQQFSKLKRDCQEIIRLSFKSICDSEIAKIMGLDTKEDVIKRKSRCKHYLIRCVRSDPRFNELFGYERDE
jgi:RNA polymerase sigma factor (sigma-70 family)